MEPAAGEDAIETAWQRVLSRWDDEQAHRRFLTLCASTDRLGEAGRRYREVRDRDPERAERAEEQIDRVLALAMESLQVLKTEPPKRSGKAVVFLIALGVSGAIIATALWGLLRIL